MSAARAPRGVRIAPTTDTSPPPGGSDEVVELVELTGEQRGVPKLSLDGRKPPIAATKSGNRSFRETLKASFGKGKTEAKYAPSAETVRGTWARHAQKTSRRASAMASLKASRDPLEWSDEEEEDSFESLTAAAAAEAQARQSLWQRLRGLLRVDFILRPDDNRVKRIVLIVFIFNLWNLGILPFRWLFVGFSAPSDYGAAEMTLTVLDQIGDFCMYYEYFLRFRTAYQDDTTIVTDPKLIRRRLLRSADTWIDTVAALPLDLFALFCDYKYHLLLRGIRFLRIPSLWRAFSVWEKGSSIGNWLRLIKMTLGIVMIIHWYSVVYYAICVVQGFGTEADWVLPDIDWMRENVDVRFAQSVYNIVSLLMGSDLAGPPVTRAELYFSIVVKLTGFMAVATFVGNVSLVLANLNAAEVMFKQKLDVMSEYMQYRNLPDDLRRRVRDHYDVVWMRQRGLEDSVILADLPKHLKREVMGHLNRELLSKVPLFQNAELGFLNELVTRLRPVLYGPGECICYQDEVAHEMFFIAKGEVSVTTDEGRLSLGRLKDGDFFGEIELLYEMKRVAQVQATTHVDLFVLTAADLHEVLADFPEMHAIMREVARKRLTETHKRRLKAARRPSNRDAYTGRGAATSRMAQQLMPRSRIIAGDQATKARLARLQWALRILRRFVRAWAAKRRTHARVPFTEILKRRHSFDEDAVVPGQPLKSLAAVVKAAKMAKEGKSPTAAGGGTWADAPEPWAGLRRGGFARRRPSLPGRLDASRYLVAQRMLSELRGQKAPPAASPSAAAAGGAASARPSFGLGAASGRSKPSHRRQTMTIPEEGLLVHGPNGPMALSKDVRARVEAIAAAAAAAAAAANPWLVSPAYQPLDPASPPLKPRRGSNVPSPTLLPQRAPPALTHSPPLKPPSLSSLPEEGFSLGGGGPATGRSRSRKALSVVVPSEGPPSARPSPPLPVAGPGWSGLASPAAGVVPGLPHAPPTHADEPSAGTRRSAAAPSSTRGRKRSLLAGEGPLLPAEVEGLRRLEDRILQQEAEEAAARTIAQAQARSHRRSILASQDVIEQAEAMLREDNSGLVASLTGYGGMGHRPSLAAPGTARGAGLTRTGSSLRVPAMDPGYAVSASGHAEPSAANIAAAIAQAVASQYQAAQAQHAQHLAQQALAAALASDQAGPPSDAE